MLYEPGTRTGHLTLVKRLDSRHWECLCDCGVVIRKELSNLARAQICTKLCKFNPLRKHDHSGKGRLSKEYRAWKNIKTRCFNMNYVQWADYGGRGITMHPAWVSSYETFLADVGPCPDDTFTLDRLDNDGHYEPGNVAWKTRSENCNNKRNNVLLTYKGETKTVTQWAEITGVNPYTMHDRVRRGWSVERAIETKTKST